MKGIATGRRLRTGIYRKDEQCLFVPMLEMYAARELFARNRKNGKPSSVNALNKTVRRKQIDYWLELYRRVPWFRGWLIEGDKPPSDVHVPTEGEVQRMVTICNYSRRMRAIGVRKGAKEYTRHFGKRETGFPADQIEGWMDWLYGGPEPAGWVVVSELGFYLRCELQRQRICEATRPRLPVATFTRWKADENCRVALHDMIVRRRSGGAMPTDSDACRALFGDGLTARTARIKNNGHRQLLVSAAERSKAAMLRFASQATEAQAMRRARERAKRDGIQTLLGKDANRPLSELRQRAREVGALDSLDSYINEFVQRIPAPPTRQSRKGQWSARGMVRPRLFVPVKWLWKFRKTAQTEWHANQIGQIEAKTPCFRLWFLDWTLPLDHRGSRGAYRRAVGLGRRDQRSPFRNEIRITPNSPKAKKPIATKLSQQDCEIAQALQQLEKMHPGDWFTAEAISKRIPRDNNSNFRDRLASLVVSETIIKRKTGRRGYRLTRPE